jgi:hypothetical protein
LFALQVHKFAKIVSETKQEHLGMEKCFTALCFEINKGNKKERREYEYETFCITQIGSNLPDKSARNRLLRSGAGS